MALKFLMVGLGGAIGAMLRYAISCIPYKGTFPVLTLITNFTGAVLIGAIVGLASQKKVSDNTQLFLKTGMRRIYNLFHFFTRNFSIVSRQSISSRNFVPYTQCGRMPCRRLDRNALDKKRN